MKLISKLCNWQYFNQLVIFAILIAVAPTAIARPASNCDRTIKIAIPN